MNVKSTVFGVLFVVIPFGIATAQTPDLGPSLQQPRRPSVSPYLSLLNRGGSLASNYYNIYRPQRDFERFQRDAAQAARNLRTEIGTQQREIDALRRSNLSPSGTSASFMTHERFFGTNRR